MMCRCTVIDRGSEKFLRFTLFALANVRTVGLQEHCKH